MIKIIEAISETEYKKDISEYISKSLSSLYQIGKSIEKDSYSIPLDDISVRIHNIYADILSIYLSFKG